MRKNSLNYIALLALLGIVAYNSVYFRKLDEVKAASGSKAGSRFDAAAYAKAFWVTKLMPELSKTSGPNAPADLSALLSLLKTDKEKAFATYSHALGIGNIGYFLVKGEGKLTAIRENDVMVSLTNGEPVNLATEFIFGNAARDASGLINITEFDNTMDLNNVSAELNTLIRNQVVPPFKASAKPGKTVKFVGAIELNKAHLHLDHLEVIPILVKQRAEGKGVREEGKE